MDETEKDTNDRDALITELRSLSNSTSVEKKKKRKKRRSREDHGISTRDRKTSRSKKKSPDRTSRTTSSSEKEKTSRRGVRREGDGIPTFPYDTPLSKDDVEVGNHLDVDSGASSTLNVSPKIGELHSNYTSRSATTQRFEVDPFGDADRFEIFSTEHRFKHLLGIVRQRWFRMVCLVLVVLLVIILLVGTSKPKSIPSQQSQPGKKKAQFKSQLMPLLSEKSRHAHLSLDSPQATALAWIMNHTNFDSFSFNRLIQRYALATIYYSTSGDLWTNSNHWLSNTDECSWYPENSDEGEEKCSKDNSFIRLALSRNNIHGSLPDEIALLTALGTIDLSRNDLQGTLSSAIGNLSKMSSLNLERNSFTGTIPVSLTKLPQIENLVLSSNRFEGGAPFDTDLSAWSNLVEISLDSNYLLTGQISTSLKALSKLQSFLIGDTSIDGAIPSEIFSLPNLKYFEATNAKLDGQIPTEIGLSTNLLFIRLSRNTLFGQLPSEIGLLSSLEFLTLAKNQITGQIPSELGLLKNVLEIYLEGNNFSGSIPSEIGQLATLSALHLAANAFEQHPLPSEICELTSEALPSNDLRVTCTVVACDCCSGEDGNSCVSISGGSNHHRHPDNCTELDVFGC